VHVSKPCGWFYSTKDGPTLNVLAFIRRTIDPLGPIDEYLQTKFV